MQLASMIDDLLRVYDFNLSFDLHLPIYDLGPRRLRLDRT